ncbi:MAG: hypothetical protein LKM37_04655 [Bacteroidales bacterium]|jgi:MraZ protein|nr:hypothetical protein [Bacteroidales bacterium]MCI1733801.1 hypothetical protein [Bacteroidales bacterium]
MVKFIGEYEVKLDDKGRLVVPSAFKSAMTKDLLKQEAMEAVAMGRKSNKSEDKEIELSFVVKKDLFANCLDMYPYDEWEKESEQVKNKLNFFKEEHAMFWREYMKGRASVTADSKFGRIMIPKSILSSIGIKKEVVFAGNDHKIEIWAKEKYGKEEMSHSDFIKLTEKILG